MVIGVRLRVSEYNQCAAKVVQLQAMSATRLLRDGGSGGGGGSGVYDKDDDGEDVSGGGGAGASAPAVPHPSLISWANLTEQVTLCCTNSWQ